MPTLTLYQGDQQREFAEQPLWRLYLDTADALERLTDRMDEHDPLLEAGRIFSAALRARLPREAC